MKRSVDGRIVFKDNTKVQVVNQIMQETSALGGDTNRLLALSILNLTQEEIVKLKKLIADTETKMFELIENYNNNVEFENPSETFASVETDDLSSLFAQLNDFVNDYTEYGSYVDFELPKDYTIK